MGEDEVDGIPNKDNKVVKHGGRGRGGRMGPGWNLTSSSITLPTVSAWISTVALVAAPAPPIIIVRCYRKYLQP